MPESSMRTINLRAEALLQANHVPQATVSLVSEFIAKRGLDVIENKGKLDIKPREGVNLTAFLDGLRVDYSYSKSRGVITINGMQPERLAVDDLMRDALASQAPGRSMSQLVADLWNDDQKMRSAAAKAIGEIGTLAMDAVPALKEALQSVDNKLRVRAEAALALGKIGDKTAVKTLVYAMDSDPDLQVRRCAVWSLWQMGSKAADATEALTFALHSVQDPELLIYASRALGGMNEAIEAVPALMYVLQNSNPKVRAEAAQALGRRGAEAKEAVAALRVAMLGDRDTSVRANAAKALGEIGGRDASTMDALRSVTKNITNKEDPIVVANAKRALSALSRPSRTV